MNNLSIFLCQVLQAFGFKYRCAECVAMDARMKEAEAKFDRQKATRATFGVLYGSKPKL